MDANAENSNVNAEKNLKLARKVIIFVVIGIVVLDVAALFAFRALDRWMKLKRTEAFYAAIEETIREDETFASLYGKVVSVEQDHDSEWQRPQKYEYRIPYIVTVEDGSRYAVRIRAFSDTKPPSVEYLSVDKIDP